MINRRGPDLYVLWYKLNAQPWQTLVDEQRAIMALPQAERDACVTCGLYYERARAMKCASPGCMDVVLCGRADCRGIPDSAPCSECHKRFNFNDGCLTTCRCMNGCARITCAGCAVTCGDCHHPFCLDHMAGECRFCEQNLCDYCIIQCDRCHKIVCSDHCTVDVDTVTCTGCASPRCALCGDAILDDDAPCSCDK